MSASRDRIPSRKASNPAPRDRSGSRAPEPAQDGAEYACPLVAFEGDREREGHVDHEHQEAGERESRQVQEIEVEERVV